MHINLSRINLRSQGIVHIKVHHTIILSPSGLQLEQHFHQNRQDKKCYHETLLVLGHFLFGFFLCNFTSSEKFVALLLHVYSFLKRRKDIRFDNSWQQLLGWLERPSACADETSLVVTSNCYR